MYTKCKCHYCFVREVSLITDHKPLVAVFSKDMATLLQRLLWLYYLGLLRIHQYRVMIMYKHGPDLFIADRLSRQNYKGNKDDKISGMQSDINAIQASHLHTRLHDSTWATTDDITGWASAVPQRTYHPKLTREQRSNTTGHESILDVLRWHGSNWWEYSKRKAYNYTGIITKIGTGTTPC